MYEFTVSIPPSLNNRMTRGMRLVPAYREWKSTAADRIYEQMRGYTDSEVLFPKSRVAVYIWLNWGDNRRRDIDNFAKPILDATTESFTVWNDDSQVDHLSITRTRDDVLCPPKTALVTFHPIPKEEL